MYRIYSPTNLITNPICSTARIYFSISSAIKAKKWLHRYILEKEKFLLHLIITVLKAGAQRLFDHPVLCVNKVITTESTKSWWWWWWYWAVYVFLHNNWLSQHKTSRRHSVVTVSPNLVQRGCFDYKYKLKRNTFYNLSQGTARPIEPSKALRLVFKTLRQSFNSLCCKASSLDESKYRI